LDLSGAFVESWWLQGVILGGYVEVILEFSDPHLADRRRGQTSGSWGSEADGI